MPLSPYLEESAPFTYPHASTASKIQTSQFLAGIDDRKKTSTYQRCIFNIQTRTLCCQYGRKGRNSLLNFVPANSSVCRSTQEARNGAASSSTDVLFRFRCITRGGPSSALSGCARPSRWDERSELTPERFKCCDTRDMRIFAVTLLHRENHRPCTAGPPCARSKRAPLPAPCAQ